MPDDVGKIKLGIEVPPGAVQKEAAKAGQQFEQVFGRSLEANSQAIKKMFSELAQGGRSGSRVYQDMIDKAALLKQKHENITDMLTVQQNKLARLKDQFGLLSEMGGAGTQKGLGMEERILKTEKAILQLTEQADKTAQAFWQAEDAINAVAQAGQTAGEGAAASVQKIDAAMQGAGRSGQIMAAKAVPALDSVGKAAQKSSGFVNNVGKMFDRAFRRVFRQVLIITVLYKALRGFIDYIGNALKENAAFTHSLNIVRTNLRVAFQPILDVVIPALTQLVKWLANATTYVAVFINSLFGKSYRDSFGAAKKLMDSYAKTVKKTLGLAGFDELNVLNTPSAGGGGDEGAPMTMPDIDVDSLQTKMDKFVQGVREGLQTVFKKGFAGGSSLFAPIGQAFQTFWKKTLLPIAEFTVKDFWLPIGKAAMDALVPIFAEIIPWAFEETGKQWQWLAEMSSRVWETTLKPMYELIRDIIISIFEIMGRLWEKYGATTLDNISKFMETLRGLWEQLWTEILEPIIIPFWEMLKRVWDEHISGLVEKVGEFIFKLVNGALEIYNEFIAPLVSWIIDFLAPWVVTGFGIVLDIVETVIGSVSDILGGVIDVLGGIIDFLVGVFTGDWDKAWNGIKNIVTGIWDTIWGAIKGVINLIIDGFNALIKGANKLNFKIPSWVPSIGGKEFGINIPLIPKLARGGIVDQPTLAMVGERNKKEAIVPLENTGLIQAIEAAIVRGMLSVAGAGGGQSDTQNGRDLVLEVDAVKLARILLPRLDNELTRQGAAPILRPT